MCDCMNYLSSSHRHESSHICFTIVELSLQLIILIIKPYLQAAMTAATLYMGWLRSTTIPCASSLTYLKSKNMSISHHTSNDLEHGTDRPCTGQWLITTTRFRALFLEQLNGFLLMKPTRCTNFTNLFWHETLHVSDSSSVFHQEFIHCTLHNGFCHTGL
jgi:hypothetical protein